MFFDESASRGWFENVVVKKISGHHTFTEDSNKVAPQKHSVQKADKCNDEAYSVRSYKRIEDSVIFGKNLAKFFYHHNK